MDAYVCVCLLTEAYVYVKQMTAVIHWMPRKKSGIFRYCKADTLSMKCYLNTDLVVNIYYKL